MSPYHPTCVKPLDPGEVHLWFVHNGEVRDENCVRALEALLSRDERSRQQRYYFPRDRHRFVVSHALVRTVLSYYVAGVSPAAWEFQAGPFGKPAIALPVGYDRLHFSLAHTSDMSVCAVAWDREVGVDVEAAAGRTFQDDLIRSSLAPGEQTRIACLPHDQRAAAFLDYWTLKEAYLKARGLGMNLPMTKVSFHFDQPGVPSLSVSREIDDQWDNWQFFQFGPDARHKVAVAVAQRADFPFALVTMDAAAVLGRAARRGA